MLIVGRRARSVAEGSLQQLEMAYNKLEDSEREKRAAGILKVRNNRTSHRFSTFVAERVRDGPLRLQTHRAGKIFFLFFLIG